MFKKLRSFKLYTLFLSIALFSVIYLFFDDDNFSGVNYVKEKVKEEVLKKKVEKNIQKETDKEPFSNVDDLDTKINETVKQAKDDVEQKELIDEKMNVSLGQKFFNRVYFSISTGTLLGYGDIYPITNLCKIVVMCQTLITISLIVV
jgi:hypothetical protein